MPRKGWTVTEVPTRWYEVLRGPQQPSVRWPVASRRQPFLTRPSRSQPEKSSPQPTQNPVLRSQPVRSSRKTCRNSTRQSHSARSRNRCPRQCFRGCLEVVAGSSTEGRTVYPCFSNWGAFGCGHRISRACQETPRQSRNRVVEASNRARSIGGVARRASCPMGVIDDLLPDTSTKQKAKRPRGGSRVL